MAMYPSARVLPLLMSVVLFASSVSAAWPAVVGGFVAKQLAGLAVDKIISEATKETPSPFPEVDSSKCADLVNKGAIISDLLVTATNIADECDRIWHGDLAPQETILDVFETKCCGVQASSWLNNYDLYLKSIVKQFQGNPASAAASADAVKRMTTDTITGLSLDKTPGPVVEPMDERNEWFTCLSAYGYCLDSAACQQEFDVNDLKNKVATIVNELVQDRNEALLDAYDRGFPYNGRVLRGPERTDFCQLPSYARVFQ